MVAEISVRVFRFPVTDVIDMIALILFSVFQYLVMWKVKCVGLSGEDYLKLIITNHMIRWKQEAAHKEAPKVREDKAR